MFMLSAGYLFSAPAQPAETSDLLVVLGGGIGDRVIKANQLIGNNPAQSVLLTGVWAGQENISTSADYRVKYLEDKGISRKKILLDSSAISTWQEAWVIRKAMLDNHWTSVLIVSDPPHMLRMSWVYRQVFFHSNLRYRLVASEPEWWKPWLWWANANSSSFVLTEIVKYIYYRVKYGFYDYCQR